MKLIRLAIVGILSVGVSAAFAAEPAKVELKDQRDKASYAIGLNWGNNIRSQGADLSVDVILQGLKDGMENKPAVLSEAQVQEVMKAFQAELRTKQEAKRKEQGEHNKTEGEAFLAENAKKAGVITLPSGLQYKIMKEGTGPKPSATDKVAVQYRGTLINGTEFDSSYKRGPEPATFGVSQVVKGWTEALELMPVGSKWQLFVPAALGYGERGSRNIEPNATLIFEVDLVEIKKAVEATEAVTSDIIKVPSAEDLKKGAKIEVIKPDQLPPQPPKK